MAHPANDDGNCLPSYHHYDDATAAAATSSRLGGFKKVQSYEYHEDNNEDENHNNRANDDDHDDDDDDQSNKDEDLAFSLNELMYSAHSFHVISLPVSITMILAALAVTYVNTPETIAQGAALMSQAYHVWKVDAENDSTSKQLVLDFANGLVIVTVIGTMTFGIVLLYKYRCMKVLIGYMMFSSMTLLGILGAELFNIAIEKYRIPIDWFTFVFGMYNFAAVGVTAIFYATGIPTYVTQAYLICSSVIISWQLSHFDTISTWTLLIMLGLYDLCAVLTPCGPLRALVNLMSDEDSPEMPGLLYEATIPEGLKRPVMAGRRNSGNDGRGDDDIHRNDNADNGDAGSSESSSPPSSMAADRYQQPSVHDAIDVTSAPLGLSSTLATVTRSDSRDGPTTSSSSGDVEMANTAKGLKDNDGQRKRPDITVSTTADEPAAAAAAATVMIPFAIAKLYRLPLTSKPPFIMGYGSSGSKKQRRKHSLQSENISTSPLLKSENGATDAADDDSSSNPSEDGSPRVSHGVSYVIPDGEYTPSQLRIIVEAILPRNGATIVKQPRRALQGDKEDRYGVIGSDGTHKRTLFVDRNNGKVYEEMQDDDDDGSAHEGRFSNTIKLGLGDFIFYSVLVAKSAQYSFTCFIASFLVILAGLGGTLVLLAVFKHALPALPISIFLAVAFYVLVRFMAEPWIHAVMNTPFYV